MFEGIARRVRRFFGALEPTKKRAPRVVRPTTRIRMIELDGEMVEEIAGTIRIMDLDTKVEREIHLPQPKRGKGPYDQAPRWSLGGLSSGADIEIDEELDGLDLAIFLASHHIILAGKVAPGSRIPNMAIGRDPDWEGEPMLQGDTLYFRFDRRYLRIGHHSLLVHPEYVREKS